MEIRAEPVLFFFLYLARTLIFSSNGCGTGHFPANSCTAEANLCTFSAVIVTVFIALFSAGFTNIST